MSNNSDDESTSSVDEEDDSMPNRQIEELLNAGDILEQKESEETKLKRVIGYHYNNIKLEVLGHTNMTGHSGHSSHLQKVERVKNLLSTGLLYLCPSLYSFG